MSVNAKIKFATRMAFVFIALMMLAFVLFVLVMMLPWGLSGAQQVCWWRLLCWAGLSVCAWLGCAKGWVDEDLVVVGAGDCAGNLRH